MPGMTKSHRPKLRTFVAIAADLAGCSREKVLVPCRRRHAARPRQVAMAGAYLRGHTIAAIARAFLRDPKTVVHALKREGVR